jgi:hypothetical protein
MIDIKIKKLLLTLTMLGAVLFGATSCLADVIDNNGEYIPSRQESSFFVRLSVPSGNITTRSTAAIVQPEAGETDVRSLHLFFFDENENFVGMVTKGDLDLAPASSCILTSGDLLEVDLTQPAAHRLNNSTDYRILAVANLGAYIDDVHEWVERLTYSTLGTIRKEIAKALLMKTTGIQSNTLLMSAEVEKSAIEHIVTIPLIRAVARLDVIVNPRLNETTPNNVKITRAKVVNVAHRTGIWNPASNDLSAHVNFPPISFDATEELLGRLYAFENEVVGVSQNDTRTTAVIIGISRSGGTTTYHRVNIAVPTRGQILRRNNVYQITINHVLAEGQPSWEAAYANPNSTLDVSINDVNIDDQGLIFIDGDNILAIPTGLFVFPPEGIDEQIFTIFTHTTDPANVRLGVSAINLDPGLSAILSGIERRLSATPATAPRRGYITLSFGNIRATIYIEQASMYQEYLMLNVGMNEIPKFPNAYLTGNVKNNRMTGEVQVTSSGKWRATVHNNFFDLVQDGDVVVERTITGNPGETFQLEINETNPYRGLRHGFVIVTLESNPNINRVLVLIQNGAAAIDIYDPDTQLLILGSPTVHFTPGGELAVAEGNVNRFRIDAENDNWYVRSIAGQGFEYAVNGNLLTITAGIAQVAHPQTISGALVIGSSEPGVAPRTIHLTQAVQSLLPTPAAVNVGAAGGVSPAITVTSTMNWEAEITATDNWVTGAPVLSRTSGASGESFTVTFPALPLMAIDIQPTATVTVSIPGTPVTSVVTVTQAARTVRNLYIRSARPANWGTWHPSGGSVSNRNNFGRLRQELASTENFGGANAVMRSGVHTFSTHSVAANIPPVGADGSSAVDIFLANNYANTSATRDAGVRNWLSTRRNRVLIVTSEYITSAGPTTSMLSPWGYTFTRAGAGTNNTDVRTVNGNANTSAIHNWLFRDGPFRILDGGGNPTDFSGSVSMQPVDVEGNPMSSWGNAEAMAEVIMWQPRREGTHAAVTICSVRNIVSIPEPEIMGLSYRTNTDWGNAANVAFTRNLAAWIVGVAQYGDEFHQYVQALFDARQ